VKESASRAAPVQYEYCEIRGGWDRHERFWRMQAWVGDTAIAGTRSLERPRGIYSVRKKNHEFNRAQDQDQAIRELVAELSNQGWEPFIYSSDGNVSTLRRVK
jgi:hypothetical protein